MKSTLWKKLLVIPVLFLSIFSTVSAQATPPVCNGVVRNGICFPSRASTGGLSDASVLSILMGFMNWLLAILGIIGIIAFVISGLQYLTAAGDERQIDTAKVNMKYSAIGIVVALSGFLIIQAVEQFLNASSFF